MPSHKEVLRVRETTHTGSRRGRIRTVETFYSDGSRSIAKTTTDAATGNMTVEATNYLAPARGVAVEEAASLGRGGPASGNKPLVTVSSPLSESPMVASGARDLKQKTREKTSSTAEAQEPVNHPFLVLDGPEVFSPTEPTPKFLDDGKVGNKIHRKKKICPKAPKPAPIDKAHYPKLFEEATDQIIGDFRARPEEVPIEDPRERRGAEDGSRGNHINKKLRKKEGSSAVDDHSENRTSTQVPDGQAMTSTETFFAPDFFHDETGESTSCPDPKATPGAIAVPPIGHNNSTQNTNYEMPSHGTVSGINTDIEATTDSQPEILARPLPAHTVNEGGQQMRTGPSHEEELVRRHLVEGDAPLVSAQAVPDNSKTASMDLSRCTKPRSRKTWGICALIIATIAILATLMGVLIPQSSSDSQETGLQDQGEQPSASPPQMIPSSAPSSLPSFTPTSRLQYFASLLEPISGVDALSDASSPQHRALTWVSDVDPLQLRYDVVSDSKRIVQRYILATLFYTTGGEYWLSNYHFLQGIHECKWWGVAKDNKYGFTEGGVFCSKGPEIGVNFIHMFANNLTGTLPVELQHLPALESLSSFGNNMHGPIPEFISNLPFLVYLGLDENKLTGTIPEFLGALSNLQEIWLYGNDLSGTIPSLLGELSNLENLSLDGNALTGGIPESFSRLSKLELLYVQNNRLNGTIPSSLARLTNLERLVLRDNMLTGSIPHSFGNFSGLKVMKLDDNMLNGSIPAALGLLTNLDVLTLHGNNFTGTIPEEICQLEGLNASTFEDDCAEDDDEPHWGV